MGGCVEWIVLQFSGGRTERHGSRASLHRAWQAGVTHMTPVAVAGSQCSLAPPHHSAAPTGAPPVDADAGADTGAALGGAALGGTISRASEPWPGLRYSRRSGRRLAAVSMAVAAERRSAKLTWAARDSARLAPTTWRVRGAMVEVGVGLPASSSISWVRALRRSTGLLVRVKRGTSGKRCGMRT